MTHENEDDLDIWEKAINSLNMGGLPNPPEEIPEIPFSELPPSEQARIIWDSFDEGKKLDRYYSNMPKEQPDFGESHIKNPEELQAGMVVVSVTTENRWVQEIIILHPYRELKNGFAGYEWIYYKDWLERSEKHVLFSHVSSFADNGLMPYDESSPRAQGKWQQFNHLCFSGEFMSETDMNEVVESEQEADPSSWTRPYGPFGKNEEIKDRYRRLYGLSKKKKK